MLGRLAGMRLETNVVHRFAHAIRLSDGRRRWDWPWIRQQVRRGLALAAEQSGEFAKLVFDSLAVNYKEAIQLLAAMTGRRLTKVHIVSGGCKNEYLCQRLADELRLPVLAGPAEASAVGNLLLQAQALNRLSAAEAEQVLEASFPPLRYEPRP